jgi:MFS family permease
MPKISFSRISILWLGSSLFWSALMSQVLAQRVEFFAGDHKGFAMAVIGGVGALASTFIQLVVGPWSDATKHPRGRRFPFLFWGVILNTFAILLFVKAVYFWQLLIAFVLIQLFLNAATGPLQALVPDLIPPHKQGIAASWMGFWSLIGQTLGLVLAGLLLSNGILNHLLHLHLKQTAEIHLAIFVIGGICALTLLLTLLLNLAAIPQSKDTPKSTFAVASSAHWWKEVWQWPLREYPNFERLFYSRFVINMGVYAAILFLRYYVQEVLHPADVSLQTMWLALGATAGGVVGVFVAGKWADHFSKRRIVYGACAFSSVAAIAFCITTSPFWAMIIAVIFGLGFGGFMAVDWAFATTLVPPKQEARFMAIFHIAFTVPQVLMLVLGGIIGQLYGYRAVFWTVPIFLAIGSWMISGVKEWDEVDTAK